jgi:hypothetical protein
VHAESLGLYTRIEYSSINKVELESGAARRRGLFLLHGLDGELALAVYLVDPDSVAAAIATLIAPNRKRQSQVSLARRTASVTI